MAASPSSAGRPETRTESVADLVAQVLDGRIRIPAVPRGLSWGSGDVRDLFDSIYRGFPIGLVLLQEAPAEAAEVRVGPLPVFGTERRDALWVVDGQQRLTALAAALGRPEPVPTSPVDPFVVYFNAATETFQAPPADGGLDPAWVPLPQMLHTSRLAEWVRASRHHGDNALRARVLEAGRRLREYAVPVYVLQTANEELLRTMFTRLHHSGKPLAWSDLREGLFGRTEKLPSSLPELADALTKLGMGRPDEADLLPCLLACLGRDVTHGLDEHLRTAPTLHKVVAIWMLPVLRRVLGFLRIECKIPHLHLLPDPALLVVLTQFFAGHPEPTERTQTLLTRWVWRTLLAPEYDKHALRYTGTAAITDDEEASVQALLRLVPASSSELVIPEVFDAFGAKNRLVLLGMTSLNPQDLESGQPIHVAELVRERGEGAFRQLFPLAGRQTHGPANRVLLPGDGAAATAIRAFIEQHGVDDPVLRSHAIDPTIAAAIRDHEVERALMRRAQLLASSVNTLGKRLAEWGRSDRPSLEYLMKRASG